MICKGQRRPGQLDQFPVMLHPVRSAARELDVAGTLLGCTAMIAPFQAARDDRIPTDLSGCDASPRMGAMHNALPNLTIAILVHRENIRCGAVGRTRSVA
jgi:hypothetical protein